MYVYDSRYHSWRSSIVHESRNHHYGLSNQTHIYSMFLISTSTHYLNGSGQSQFKPQVVCYTNTQRDSRHDEIQTWSENGKEHDER